jgi:hypothetical protein
MSPTPLLLGVLESLEGVQAGAKALVTLDRAVATREWAVSITRRPCRSRGENHEPGNSKRINRNSNAA